MLCLVQEEGAGKRHVYTVTGIGSSAGVRKDALSPAGGLYNRYFPPFSKILFTALQPILSAEESCRER